MQRVIKEWFALVDDDGSGTLEHHELLGALQVRLVAAGAAVWQWGKTVHHVQLHAAAAQQVGFGQWG